MADERSTSPVFGDAGGTSPRDDDESTEEAAGAKRAAPAGGRAQSKKRGTTKSLRIGIIAGKVDDDCCVAPNIPESHWVAREGAQRVRAAPPLLASPHAVERSEWSSGWWPRRGARCVCP